MAPGQSDPWRDSSIADRHPRDSSGGPLPDRLAPVRSRDSSPQAACSAPMRAQPRTNYPSASGPGNPGTPRTGESLPMAAGPGSRTTPEVVRSSTEAGRPVPREGPSDETCPPAPGPGIQFRDRPGSIVPSRAVLGRVAVGEPRIAVPRRTVAPVGADRRGWWPAARRGMGDVWPCGMWAGTDCSGHPTDLGAAPYIVLPGAAPMPGDRSPMDIGPRGLISHVGPVEAVRGGLGLGVVFQEDCGV